MACNKLIYLLLNIFVLSVSADDILGCGGFVKSDVPLDFSRIQIKLLTKQGSLKDQTECAPNNGYYFLPFYGKGEYILKLIPPNGWSFDKTEIHLNVDGKSDPCTTGKDVNFQFKGFGITGQVLSVNSDKGPSGVKVNFLEQGKIRETVTSVGGYFHFTPVVPGTYTVVASHPKWKFIKNSLTVKVQMANTELPKDSFVIAGYDVSGKVTTLNDEAISDVHVVIYNSKLKQMISGCSVEIPIGFEPQPQLGSPLCTIKSNRDGVFQFETLPPGKYIIVPFFKKNNVHFELQPKLIEFVIEHDSVQLEKKFQVTGLTLSSKVVLPPDNKDGATITLNGEKSTMTNSKGEYVLSNIRPASYKLSAIAENVLYEEIDITLSPTKYSIEVLKPRAFKVCGKVISDDIQNVVYTETTSNQQHNAESDPKSGEYCLYLEPGEYEVQVIPKESGENIQFYPLSQTIFVGAESSPPIVFSQLKAKVTGSVDCFECNQLQVELQTMNSKLNFKAVVSNGKYTFTDIPPGRYQAQIIGNNLCWEQDKYFISINSDQASIQTFKQTGYRVQFKTDYETQIQYELLDDPQKGVITNDHCLTKPGRYRFTPIGCHQFDPKSVEWSTNSNRAPIIFNAVTHAHGVQVISNDKSAQVQLQIYNKENPSKTILDPIKVTPGNNNFIHHFTLQLQQHQNINIEPISKVLLFKPETLQLVGSSDCVAIAAKINGVKGKIISGQVNPPLSGIQITLSTNSGLKITQMLTKADGKFHFGPLDATNDYKITASKDNYYIDGPDQNGNLVARKMADINVLAVDEDQQPLNGVLISVSGGNNYRKNLQTDQNGRIEFTSLSPGEYFTRPMMKEYRFEPNSKMVVLKEGDSYKLTVVGKRVAFSAYGHVQTLSGLGENEVLVMARSTSKDPHCEGHIEEATTDITGSFRIRGLLPSCSYDLQIKQDSIYINNVQNDIHNLQLVSLQSPAYTDVTVHVYTPKPEDYRSLRVKLGYGDQLLNPIQSVRLDPHIVTNRKVPIPEPGVLVVLNSVPFDHKQYYVQLDTSTSSHSFEPIYFYSNTSFKHIYLRFDPKTKQIEYDLNNQTSMLVFPLVILIGFLFYNNEKVKEFVQSHLPTLKQHIQQISQSVSQQSSGNSKDPVSQSDYNAQVDRIVKELSKTGKKVQSQKVK